MFTLEALQADFGDALLVRFGATPGRQILLDAGPTGIYPRSVRPRLVQLGAALDDGEPLRLERVIVSHMDSDHITGIVDLFSELEDDAASQMAAPFDVGGLWLNAFDLAALGVDGPAALTAAVASVGEAVGMDVGPESEAVIATIPQARDLSGVAKVLKVAENADFPSGMAMATVGGPVVVDLDGDLTLTVIGPHQKRIDDLRAAWDAFLAAQAAKAPKKDVATAALAVDRSVYNLSSIIILAERKGRTMLLTGDGLGADILADLDVAGRLKDGAIHVDILKMPHHGSIRNVLKPAHLLEQITADHYVFSANGKDGNPDPATIERLVAARGAAEYAIHFTNPDARIDAVLKADRDAHRRNYEVDVRPAPALLLSIELE